jgi:transposase
MILQMAQGSIGCEAGPAVKFEAELMVEGLRQIRLMIGDTDKQIQDLCREFAEYEYLLSIPGFGPDVSSKVLGAVGDPFRFENGRQVLKLAGWDLNAERSGKSAETARPVISKKGKADLR